LLLWS